MKIDPRTKLYAAALLTTLAVLRANTLALTFTALLTLLVAIASGFSIFGTRHLFSRFLKPIFVIFMFQCLFNRSGQPLVSIAGVSLVTDGGFFMGLNFLLRMLIIIFCAALIATSSSRDLIQGLVQLKFPHTLAMMTSLAVSFIPIFKDEIDDAVTSLRLRGINFKRISFTRRVRTISYLFAPILASTVRQSQEIAISLELRGFRRPGRRSSWVVLRMNSGNYLAMFIVSLLSAAIWYFL